MHLNKYNIVESDKSASYDGRRNFIKKSLVTMAGFSSIINEYSKFSHKVNVNSLKSNLKDLKISVFSKNLQFLDYAQMASSAAEMGFNGIDLTVRQDGHVLPERVKTDLPIAVKIIRSTGLDVYTITTSIQSANEKYASDIIETASSLGIKYYRMGWFTYPDHIPVQNSIADFRKKLQQLQEMNKKFSIHGAYQNHSGNWFGATCVDLWEAIKDLDSQYIGCQYDIRHATAEGAHSWPIGLDLLHSYIKTINFKDFNWKLNHGKWQEENVAIGKGMVDFTKYISLLNGYNFNGSVCIHYEYDLGGAENGSRNITIPKEVIFEKMKNDLNSVKKLLLFK